LRADGRSLSSPVESELGAESFSYGGRGHSREPGTSARPTKSAGTRGQAAFPE